MRTIFADFNARTESGHVRLGCRGSREDLHDQGIEVGDWMWLSDGELVVGAQLAADDRYGIVGEPRWQTLVHLDDDLGDFAAIREQFLELLRHPRPGSDDVKRLFQLATILDLMKPAAPDDDPGSFAARRIGALLLIDEPALALVDLKEAMEARPDDPGVIFPYLEVLRMVDLDRAALEVDRRTRDGGIAALVLAACINIRSTVADRLSDRDFRAIGPQILEWVARFDHAPGRREVPAPILSGVQFNWGLTLLRLGRLDEARDALGLAHANDPGESAIDEALALEVFDERAREIAAGMREKLPPIAA